MELSQQVVSLELAKQLKELGFEQNSLFSWYHFTSEDKENGIKDEWKIASGSPTNNELSAYTVAELGLLIPIDYWNCQSRTMNNGFSFHYGDEEAVYAETEADARAKLLIDLKTNKLI